ncbi:putative reverse transcriptase domain-containing protein [Tanacetum coccineum]|uniref:Reverse transcriptase domain-containing protein n=1 Tax=Tanacetum coccineum TaxID=301880 RepID=A0ABQ5BRW0_9ASTR
MESGSYWLDKVRTSIWRDVRTLAIEEAYTTKYSIHPGADTMLCGFRLTNRWMSMKKDIASCDSKYLAYSEEEVEYQGSLGLLLQPELPKSVGLEDVLEILVFCEALEKIQGPRTSSLGAQIWVEEDPKEDIPPIVASPPGSPPISPPPLSESSSNSDSAAPVTADRTFWVPPPGSTFEVGGPSSVSSPPPHLLVHEVRRLREDTETLYGSVRTLTRGMETCRAEIAITRTWVDRIRRLMDAFDVDIETAEARQLQAEQERASDREEIQRLRKRLDAVEAMRRGAMEAHPSERIDVLVVYGDAQLSESHGPPDGSQNRANLGGTGGVGGAGAGNAGGNIAPEACRCTYKAFFGCNPITFNGTKGAVGLSRWIEKLESIFHISKCANEDKVKYEACTLQGRALTWWNGYVHSLRIDAANQIPWTEFKKMMTDEYCPKNELQRMEQELWNLTVKGDDIKGYTNRFHKLAALYPSMVTPEYKKIESLMDQAIRFKDARISDSNKQKWEEQQKGNNNNHNNSHQHQQNRRKEVAKAYVATPAEGKESVREQCMTRSSNMELFTPFEDSEREFRSSRKLFKTPSDYGSGVARLKIDDKAHFELKGQFLKELRDNTFSGLNHEDVNEHIEKVFEIVDLFHIPEITQDQIMLRAFLMSPTGVASSWLRNEPSGSTITWEALKKKFLSKYCPPARTAKKIEEINKVQQEPDETLYQA